MKLDDLIKQLTDIRNKDGNLLVIQLYSYSEMISVARPTDFKVLNDKDLFEEKALFISPWGSGT